jgi:enoyl-CoA hydratase
MIPAPIVSLEVSRDEGVAWIWLNRPAVANAIDLRMLDSLEEVFESLEANAAIRSVVISSRLSTVFSAGGDIAEMRALDRGEGESFVKRGQSVLEGISRSRLVTLAALNGHTLGGGLELALACDIRIASNSAWIGFPEVRVGLIPGWGGTQRLVRLVGPSKAVMMIVTGDRVSAGQACDIGIVDQVVPGDRLADHCTQLARTIAANSPKAVAAAKAAIVGARSGYASGFEAEASAWLTTFLSDDRVEGLTAFLEKREPRWANDDRPSGDT